MGKYLVVYKNSLSSFMQYRLNLGLLAISHLISLSGLIFLWVAVYASGQSVAGYDLVSLLIYYTLIAFIRITVGDGVGVGFEVSEEINRGGVTSFLLRPFSYSWKRFFDFAGGVTVNLVFVLPVFLGLFFWGRKFFSDLSFEQWLQFALMVFLAMIFNFLIYYLAALSSFWLHRGESLIYGIILISSLFSGSLVPLDFFPTWFVNFNNYLPLKYLFFVPIQSFLGRLDSFGHELLGALIWVVVLLIIITLVWKRGIKKYEAVGQ